MTETIPCSYPRARPPGGRERVQPAASRRWRAGDGGAGRLVRPGAGDCRADLASAAVLDRAGRIRVRPRACARVRPGVLQRVRRGTRWRSRRAWFPPTAETVPAPADERRRSAQGLDSPPSGGATRSDASTRSPGEVTHDELSSRAGQRRGGASLQALRRARARRARAAVPADDATTHRHADRDGRGGPSAIGAASGSTCAGRSGEACAPPAIRSGCPAGAGALCVAGS